jgi:hypothetical protein
MDSLAAVPRTTTVPAAYVSLARVVGRLLYAGPCPPPGAAGEAPAKGPGSRAKNKVCV